MPRAKQEWRRSRRRLEVRYGPDEPRHIGYSRNLSRSGLMVGAVQVFAPGTLLRMELAFGRSRVCATGTVIWARAGGVDWVRTGRVGMGIRFVDPPPGLADLLAA